MLRNLFLHSDRLGIITSVGCAIHCTLLPLLVSGLSVLDVEFLENEMLEWGMIALAFIFGMISFYHGFVHHHRKVVPVTLFAIGFSCLLLNRVFSEK